MSGIIKLGGKKMKDMKANLQCKWNGAKLLGAPGYQTAEWRY